jgi:hypothetical protein
MRIVKPLVVSPTTGLKEQMQADDILGIPVTTTQLYPVTNGESATTLIKGMAVYISGASTVKRGRANALATATIIGLLYDTTLAAGAAGYIQTDDIFIATTGEWDAVTGDTGGLVPNTNYFLDSASEGKITKTPPDTSVVGNCNTYIGLALSATALDLSIEKPIKF